MSNDRDTDDSGLLGLSVERAADRVAPTVDDEAETVEKSLRPIADDGTITRTGVQDALGHLSKVVATPETRVEVARDTLADAREAADPIADTPFVDARLSTFEGELDALEGRVDDLGTRLTVLVDRGADTDDLYDLAREVGQLREDATDAQQAVDALAEETKAFVRKVSNPDHWADTIREDLDHLEESLDKLRTATDRLSQSGSADNADPAAAWADTSLRYRVQALFVADVRTELDALGALGERTDTAPPVDEVESRLAELEELQTEITDRLDEVVEPSWAEEYADVVASFEETVSAFEPPVPWDDVQRELKRHREQLTE